MRFLADGPDIPQELLDERDRGGVVFFCGAGVSMPAGLPSFEALAYGVMRRLGTPNDAPSKRLLDGPGGPPPLDRVFGLLQQEYSRERIDRTVAALLRTRRQPQLGMHRTILSLSSNQFGRAQLVTTNFDLLFERAMPGLRIHVGPSVPELGSLGTFDGIVYLHGRRHSSGTPPGHRLVLSSGDFGRAYLSEGWATRFVRELMKSYTLILVGYSASDPPVRYLLEGLHAADPQQISRIYAFDHGPTHEVVLRWRGLGVHPVPYSRLDRDHSGLWSTLHRWAQRAEDPDGWCRFVIDMARRGPRALEPFERGQVASLVTSAEGAAEFAGADPPPPAEWICVFDSNTRCTDRQASTLSESPSQPYGVDSDPSPHGIDESRSKPSVAVSDYLGVLQQDERADRFARLAGMSSAAGDPLPRRLLHLAQWIARVAGDPAAIWWVAGYKTLSSQICARVDRAVQAAERPLGSLGQRAWPLFLRRFQRPPRGDEEWYDVASRFRLEPWSSAHLARLAEVTQPYIDFERPLLHRRVPPQVTDPTGADLRKWVDFSVSFPRIELAAADVPRERLGPLLEILRRSLALGSSLLSELGTRFWRTSTFYPTDEEGDHYPSDASRFLHLLRDVIDRLAAWDPQFVRDDMRRWPPSDLFFFDKLRLYCWTHQALATGREAAVGILGLSDDGFWEESHRRECLHTLLRRWSEMPLERRVLLETRILLGEPKWESEEEDAHALRRTANALSILGWLRHHGCDLSSDALSQLADLEAALPDWDASRMLRADRSFESRVGYVEVIEDPRALLDVPIGQVLQRAVAREVEAAHPFRAHDPFAGLSSLHPRRALLVLSREARRGSFPAERWTTLLEHWPADTPSRLLLTCCRWLRSIPDAELLQCRYAASRWMKQHASELAVHSLDLFVETLCHLTAFLSRHGEESTRSGIGDITVADGPPQSRRTTEHAINSPGGHLAMASIEALAAIGLAPKEGLPPAFRDRLEALLALPGEGGEHVRCVLSSRLSWLHKTDSNWTVSKLLPCFEPRGESAEAAWNGLLQASRMPSPELFRLLKRFFLGVFEVSSTWHWGGNEAQNKLAERLLVACYWRRQDPAYVTLGEARKALRLVNDEARAHAIWFLATAFKEKDWWDTFGRSFVQRAWPQEVEFQSAAVSAQFAFLAERAGEQFPEVVETVSPLLTPVEQLDMVMFRSLDTRTDISLASRFPDSMIDLLDRLISSNRRNAPYRLAELLEETAAAQPGLRKDLRWRRLSLLTATG
jgi:hypothetical protein